MEAGSRSVARDEGKRGPAGRRRRAGSVQDPRVSLRPIATSSSSTETTLDIRFDFERITGDSNRTLSCFGSRAVAC